MRHAAIKNNERRKKRCSAILARTNYFGSVCLVNMRQLTFQYESNARTQTWSDASLAQLAEHALRKRMVMGSIPIGGLYSDMPS